jgi:hypothetical protein
MERQSKETERRNTVRNGLSEGKNTRMSKITVKLTNDCVFSFDNLLGVHKVGRFETNQWKRWQTSDGHGDGFAVQQRKDDGLVICFVNGSNTM